MSRFHFIKISREAAATLRTERPGAEGVLRDRILDFREAPDVYSLLAESAGEDRVLSLEEAKGVDSTRWRDVPLQAVADREKLSEAVARAKRKLDDILSVSERWHRKLKEKDESFRSFIAPSNAYGFAQYFDWQGKTRLGQKRAVLERYMEEIAAQRTGAGIFASQIETGRHNFGSRYVRKFLMSAQALHRNIPSYFDPENAAGSEISDFLWLEATRKGILEAKKAGFAELAFELWEDSLEHLRQKGRLLPGERMAFQEILESALPGGGEKILENVSAVLDPLVSIESLAAMTCGVGLAKWAAHSAQAVRWFGIFDRRFLPGVPVFQGAGGHGVLKFAGNATAEVGKGALWIFAGKVGGWLSSVGKEEGGEIAAGALLMTAAFTSTLRGLVSAGIAGRIALGEGEVVARELHAIGLSAEDPRVTALLRAGAREVSGRGSAEGMRQTLKEAFETAVEAPAKAAQVVAEMETAVGQQMARVEALLAASEQQLDRRVMEGLRREMEDVARGGKNAEALRHLRDLEVRIQRGVKEASRKISLSQEVRTHSSGGHPVNGGKNGVPETVKRAPRGGGRRTRTPQPGSSAGSESLPQKLADTGALDGMAAMPPENLRQELIATMTDDLIRVEKGALRGLHDLYAAPSRRAVFWLRLRELATHQFENWPVAAEGRNIVREAVLGDFLLRVEIRQTGYKIVEVISR